MENIAHISRNHTDRINTKMSIFSIVVSLFLLINFFLFSVDHGSSSLDMQLNNYVYAPEYTRDLSSRNLRVTYGYDIFIDEAPEDYRKNITHFFSNVTSFIYEGTWTSRDPIKEFECLKGVIRLHPSYGLNIFSNQTQFSTSFKFLDGEFVDDWYFLKVVKAFSPKSDEQRDLFDFNENSLSWKDFDIYIIKGQLFDKVSMTYECKADLNIKWDYKIVNSIPIINRLRGSVVTKDNCDVPLKLEFASEIEDPNKDNLAHVLYSLMVSALCISQILSTVWLNQKIVDSYSNSNSLSLFTVGQNIIWNAYGCLCHFFLAVNNEPYVPHFGIPAFFFFTNFSIFELRLLYNLWKNQNIGELNDINVVRKKLIKFYITFYIFLFLSLFFVTKFYFEEPYIMVAIIVTWLPQIIYNVIYKNHSSIPLINIILNTINKGLIPMYFRGCPNNVFHIKTDLKFVYICLAILTAEVIVLYLQTLLGPRFFIPCKFTSANEHKFYHTKEEIIGLKKEFEFAECSICLFPLFSMEPIRKVEESENHFFEEASQPNKCTQCLMKFYNVVFDFHEYHFFKKKPFILTPCNHVFHSECLESWLKLKRECPTDRTIIPPIDQ